MWPFTLLYRSLVPARTPNTTPNTITPHDVTLITSTLQDAFHATLSRKDEQILRLQTKIGRLEQHIGQLEAKAKDDAKECKNCEEMRKLMLQIKEVDKARDMRVQENEKKMEVWKEEVEWLRECVRAI